MDLRITSKRAGFRRCGVEHPATPVTYPDGRFTVEQVARLKAEPMLVVEEVADPEDGGDAKTGKGEKSKKTDRAKKDEEG
jgi:hypothetical protein